MPTYQVINGVRYREEISVGIFCAGCDLRNENCLEVKCEPSNRDDNKYIHLKLDHLPAAPDKLKTCEWIPCPSSDTKWYAPRYHGGGAHIIDDWKVCPYCGKAIERVNNKEGGK